MKKIFILSIAMLSFTAMFAQQRSNDWRTDRNQSTNVRTSNDRNDGRYNDNHVYNQQDRNYNDRSNGYGDRNNGYNDRNNNYNDRERQMNIDRVNREYDQRINEYRNDRRINSYERDRRIRQAEYERSQRVNSFGKGVVVGAVATIILGAILSH